MIPEAYVTLWINLLRMHEHFSRPVRQSILNGCSIGTRCMCFASLSRGVAKLLKAYGYGKRNGKVLAASCCEFIVCWMPKTLMSSCQRKGEYLAEQTSPNRQLSADSADCKLPETFSVHQAEQANGQASWGAWDKYCCQTQGHLSRHM